MQKPSTMDRESKDSVGNTVLNGMCKMMQLQLILFSTPLSNVLLYLIYR